MARLLIEAGSLTFERTASNAKADRLITACALHFGYTGSTADKAAVLAYFGQALVRRMEEIASAEVERQATSAASATAKSDLPQWSS